MDSLTQLTLGAAVCEAAVGKKIGRKASVWGAVLGTLPDLDVLIPMGDPIADFVYHRSSSHSIFVLALLAPICAWAIMKIHKWENSFFKRWVFCVLAIFYTHIAIDSMTVYGTQIFWPLTNYPVSIGSVFIIDPLYTVPLLIGLILCLIFREKPLGFKANNIGLLLSTCYMIWSLIAQYSVRNHVSDSIKKLGETEDKVLTIPTPFNTFLWRIVVVGKQGYHVGYYSLFDKNKNVNFSFYESHYDMVEKLISIPRVKDMQRFTHGFWSIERINNNWVVSDIRMGLEGGYVFKFVVAKALDEFGSLEKTEISRVYSTLDLSRLTHLFQRIFNDEVIF